MRVVAGSAKGRRLLAPAGTAIRPTGDRVREATFNALASIGAIEGAAVLDLYAGSGAMGIEALSRGAAAATFVDSDSRAVAAIRANVAAAGVADRSQVVRSDVGRFLAAGGGPAGLAILDPPYATTDESWRAMLHELDAEVAVLESDREVGITDRWEMLRVRRYGTTVISLAARRSSTALSEDP